MSLQLDEDQGVAAQPKEGQWLLPEALLGSWLAWGLLCAYVALSLAQPNQNQIVTGTLVLFAIVLAMNGLARTDLWLTSRPPLWWKKHPLLKGMHFIHNEGELAGIMVGAVALGCIYWKGGHPHWQVDEATGIAGIMSAAMMAAVSMMPILAITERIGGRWLALKVGALLASVTGPAVSIFNATYFKPRVEEENRAKAATGMATSIGSGAGLIPYASPPIIIVWAFLGEKFGWGLGHLLFYVGIGCLMHVALTSWWIKDYIAPLPRNEEKTTEKHNRTSLWPLAVLVGVVALNMTLELHHQHEVLWIANGFVTLWALRRSYKQDAEHGETNDGHSHTARFQPLMLAFLLLALGFVGEEATPLIEWIASYIPQNLPPLAVAIVLWWVTAATSHIADNALASKVFSVVALMMAGVFGFPNLYAAAVILGALFGGFLLIPANLPNFPLARAFGLSSGAWLSESWKYYWTGVAHIAWLVALYFMG